MTPEEVEQIQDWLGKNGSVSAELAHTDDPWEMELRLSRKNVKGQVEYVIIGIPMMQEISKRLT